MASPLPKLTLEMSSFTDEKSRHVSKIEDSFFNQGVSLILPSCPKIPEDIKKCFTDLMVYKITQLPVYRLVEMPFIKAFVRKGAVQVLSTGTKIDTDDCVAISPSGRLVLHLTIDTYQELGLDSVPQTHQQKKNNIFQVRINLNSDSFKPGKKGYEKVLDCLKNRLGDKFDFLISWIPQDPEICSSSIAVYFSDLCQRVDRADPVLSSRTLTNLALPRVEAADPDGNNLGCHFLDVFEWMGAVTCGVDISESDPESYISSYTCPSPQIESSRVCVLRVSGFIPAHAVLQLVKCLRDMKMSAPQPQLIFNHSAPPPVFLTIHGATDSPLVGQESHDVYMSGCHLRSFVMFPDDKYWLYTASYA